MILTTIRESIPVENILKAYLDETEEIDVKIEERQEIIPVKSKVDEKIEESSQYKQDNEMKDLNKSVENILTSDTTNELENPNLNKGIDNKLEIEDSQNVKLKIDNLDNSVINDNQGNQNNQDKSK